MINGIKNIWTPQANSRLAKVIIYLEKNWIKKEILNLENNINELIERISKYPKICPATLKYKNVQKGLVDKKITLFIE